MPTIFRRGEAVVFTAKSGRRFKGTISEARPVNGKIYMLITGDPYPVPVNIAQVVREGGEEEMPVATKSSEARRLAKEAKMLGIRGYQRMSLSQLRDAVEEKELSKRPKASSKKAPAKKAARKAAPAPSRPRKAVATKKSAPKRAAKKVAAKKVTVAKKAKKAAPVIAGDPSNPFRNGSNSFLMTEELLKGGSREQMVRRLKKAMPLNPWSKDKEEDPDFAINKRLMMVAADLQKTHGFTIEKEGRGSAGTIQVFPPSKRKSAASKSTTKKAKKVTGQKRAGRAKSAAKTTKRRAAR